MDMVLESSNTLDEIQQNMYTSSSSFYAKNIEGEYISCNEYLLNFGGFSKANDLVGESDFHTPWVDHAKKLRENDNIILQFNKSITFYEGIENYKHEYKIYISRKQPLYINDKLVGTAGISMPAPSEMITNKKEFDSNITFSDIAKEKIINLSIRRKEILFYLIKGFSIKEIASTLNISKRTVEHHIEAIKDQHNPTK